MENWWSCQLQRVMMNGTKSSRKNVTSKVPHRFTLEPVQPSVITWITKLSVLSGSLQTVQNWEECLMYQMVLAYAIQQEYAAI